MSNGVVKKEDYKFLCVLTYNISQKKSKIYNSDNLNVAEEFRAAIFGEEKHYFEKNTDKHIIEYSNLHISKSNYHDPIAIGFQDYLKNFDVIIACNIFPFLSSSSNIFYFYFGSEQLKKELKPFLSEVDLFNG